MTVLEDLKNGAVVQGIIPSHPVEIVSVDWIGDQAINLVYRVPGGSVAETGLTDFLYQREGEIIAFARPDLVL